jgi:hypothetical protein
MSCCENCGESTSKRLIAECGYTYACEDCFDEMWSSGGYTDTDGISKNLWNEYI